MNLLDQLRLGQVERVIVLAQVPRVMCKLAAAVIRFGQAARLNHRAHGAIHQQNALLHQLEQFVAGLLPCIHNVIELCSPEKCPRLKRGGTRLFASDQTDFLRVYG